MNFKLKAFAILLFLGTLQITSCGNHDVKIADENMQHTNINALTSYCAADYTECADACFDTTIDSSPANPNDEDAYYACTGVCKAAYTLCIDGIASDIEKEHTINPIR